MTGSLAHWLTGSLAHWLAGYLRACTCWYIGDLDADSACAARAIHLHLKYLVILPSVDTFLPSLARLHPPGFFFSSVMRL